MLKDFGPSQVSITTELFAKQKKQNKTKKKPS